MTDKQEGSDRCDISDMCGECRSCLGNRLACMEQRAEKAEAERDDLLTKMADLRETSNRISAERDRYQAALREVCRDLEWKGYVWTA